MDGGAVSGAFRRSDATALLAILLLAAGVRLYGITFGLPAMLDPDELIFELGALHMLESGVGNPGWFGHPATTTIYVLALINLAVLGGGMATGAFASPDAFAQAVFLNPALVMLPGRIAMILFAVLGVWLIYKLGRTLGGPIAGLIAAFMLAISPLHVTWSQVVRSDILATTFFIATMVVSWRPAERGSRRDIVLACLCVALATASKWPFAVAMVCVWGSLALHWRTTGETGRFLVRAATVPVLCVMLTIAISPFLLIDWATLVDNLRGEAQTRHVGATGSGFLGNAWFYLSGPLNEAVGPAGLLLALLGFYLLRKNPRFLAIVLAPTLVMFAVVCAQNLVWDRWAIAFLPAIVLAIAIASGAIWKWAASWRPPARIAAIAVGGGVAILPLCLVLAGNAHGRLNDNRRAATDWAAANLPAGSTVLIEHFAFDLLDTNLEPIFPVGLAGCLNARSALMGQIGYEEIDGLRGGRSNLDLAAIPPAKMASCQADYAILTEASRYANERDVFPAEYRRYADLIGRSQLLAQFHHQSGLWSNRSDVVILQLRQHSSLEAGNVKTR